MKCVEPDELGNNFFDVFLVEKQWHQKEILKLTDLYAVEILHKSTTGCGE